MQQVWAEEANVWRKRQCLWLVMDRFKNLKHFKIVYVMHEPPKLILIGSSSELHIKEKHSFPDL